MADRRRRLPRARGGMLAWLTTVWVLLWGDLTLANVVLGLLVALFVTTVAPLPRTSFVGRLRPWGLVRLLVRLAADVVVASWQVAGIVLSGRRPRGAVVRVRLRSHSDVYLTVVAAVTALVPGSVVVEAHRFTSTLYVHLFDVRMQGGLWQAHRQVLEHEELVLRALASDAELRAAGYRPGAGPRAGRTAPADPARSRWCRAADADLDAREAHR